MHILGLGIDENAPSLQALTREMQAARAGRNPRIIAKLQALGLAIDLADVLAQAGGGEERILGRLHIAQTLAAKGHVRCPAEAFDRYLGDGGPAAVPKDRWRPRQVIDAIHGGGGIAMLAHPRNCDAPTASNWSESCGIWPMRDWTASRCTIPTTRRSRRGCAWSWRQS